MPLAPSFDHALAFARDLIRIPSLPGSEGALARRVLSEMEGLGYLDLRVDAVGNVLGRIPGRGEAPAVLINAHLDMVAEGDASEWEYPPFEAVVAEGFLHGRGAMDIKGPLAIQTHAAASLAGRAPGDVWVAHTVFEERGGWGMVHLLESGALPRLGAVIIGESTHGDIAIGHRGRAEVEVVLHGVAGHASAPEQAHNALDALPAVLTAVAKLVARQGARVHPFLGSASLSPTQVDVIPQSRNVIPDRVTVTLDWRILPGEDAAGLLERVRLALGEAGVEVGRGEEGRGVEVRMAVERQTSWTGVTEDRELFTPGFLMDPSHPLVAAAAVAVGRRNDPGGPAVVRPWRFATDGGWSYGIHGIPTLGFAPGEERHAHTNVERLELGEARWGYERYPLLIEGVQRALMEEGAEA
jgi:succinyl-diaminopimelate desuccinylase